MAAASSFAESARRITSRSSATPAPVNRLLFREILYQVERRGDTAIIFDPDRQYIQEFYRPERGDIVLNPKDDRCPYWYLGGEAKDEAEATALAVGLFPDEPSTQKFFLNQARAIFAFLVAKYKPTVQRVGLLA